MVRLFLGLLLLTPCFASALLSVDDVAGTSIFNEGKSPQGHRSESRVSQHAKIGTRTAASHPKIWNPRAARLLMEHVFCFDAVPSCEISGIAAAQKMLCMCDSEIKGESGRERLGWVGKGGF